MEWLFTPESLIALVTLTVLEIVLGIDNVIFISILSGKLPAEQQQKARTIGLSLAAITRVLLLLSITWVMRLTAPLFEVFGNEISGRDLILILGGLFLIAKSTHEIHEKLEGGGDGRSVAVKAKFTSIIFQILVLDVVFSLDSVITAVGMANRVEIMIAAVLIAVAVMVLAARSISDFVDKHPTVKMLALSFLLLIGVTLIVEGLDQHISKGYIYFAMAFSVFVEMLNLKMRSKSQKPVKLRTPFDKELKESAKS